MCNFVETLLLMTLELVLLDLGTVKMMRMARVGVGVMVMEMVPRSLDCESTMVGVTRSRRVWKPMILRLGLETKVGSSVPRGPSADLSRVRMTRSRQHPLWRGERRVEMLVKALFWEWFVPLSD